MIVRWTSEWQCDCKCIFRVICSADASLVLWAEKLSLHASLKRRALVPYDKPVLLVTKTSPRRVSIKVKTAHCLIKGGGELDSLLLKSKANCFVPTNKNAEDTIPFPRSARFRLVPVKNGRFLALLDHQVRQCMPCRSVCGPLGRSLMNYAKEFGIQ